MISLLFDIETDAIAATKIWGVSIYNMNTGKINSYYQDELTEGIKKLQEKGYETHSLIKFPGH